MPLEVSASLDRDVPVYLTGEVISVRVTVRNVGLRGRDSLAWGSVQFSCERTIGSHSADRDRPTTAIAKSASTVYTSLPIILFCDVAVQTGQQKHFQCEIPLPTHSLPPTFRGQSVKYLNRITVAVQHVRAPIKLIHIPVRIIPAVGLEPKDDESPRNPFTNGSNCLGNPSVSEAVSAAVDNITAPRKPHTFTMKNADGVVTLLTLFKKAFRLGEDVVGHLDFSGTVTNSISTLKIETVELVIDDVVGENGEKRSGGRCHIVHQAHDHNVCAFSTDSSFRISIPMSAPPSFSTDSVQLKWRLRFEFVTNPPIMQEIDSGLTVAPLEVPIQTVTWQVDLFVLPCGPENAALTDFAHMGHAIMTI